MGRTANEDRSCISISFDGTKCGKLTTDSSGLCSIHRRYFRSLLEVEIMHCHDCPLPVYRESGEVDLNKTKANCSKYMSNAQALCFFELGDVFSNFGEKDDLRKEFDWVLMKEKMMAKRAMMFQAKTASISPDAMKLLDTYFTHLERRAKFEGYVQGPNSRIQVKDEGEAAEILSALMNEPDGTMDVDFKKHVEAMGQGDAFEKMNYERKLNQEPESSNKPKTDIVKDILEDKEE